MLQDFSGATVPICFAKNVQLLCYFLWTSLRRLFL